MATLKYANEPISEAFIRKSGLPAGAMSARVKMDEDPVDAIEEILPATISEVGIKIDENAAAALIVAFFKNGINYMCREARNIRIGDFLNFFFSTKGSGVKLAKSDRIEKKDVGIAVHLLKGSFDYKFKLRNLIDGIEIVLHSVTGITEGRSYNTFAAGENVRINGENLRLLEGDSVEAKVGEESYGLCTVVESAVDHIIVTPPASLGALPAGTKVEFYVTARGGDPKEGQQTKHHESTVAAYDGTVPLITAFNQGDLEEGTFHCSASEWVTLKGAGFRSLNIQSLKVGHRSGNTYDKQINATEVSIVDDNTMRFKLSTNTSTMTDEELREADLSVTLYTQSATSAAYSLTYVG